MRAMVLDRYGPPDALRWMELPLPEPGPGQVRVRVEAASVNDWDLGILRGGDPLTRALYGWRRPKVRILGCDVAGRVEAAGPGMARLKRGDAVFGDLSGVGFGAFAEAVCVPEAALTPIPEGMTFGQAAALPQASMLAVQGLQAGGPLRPGERVLLNGAGGGVGTFALQLAKAAGAEVTVVDRGDKLERLRALGADHALDYTRDDFAALGPRFDRILDVQTRRSPADCVRALRPGGTYATVGGSLPRLLQAALLGPWIRRRHGRDLRVVALKPNRDLPQVIAAFRAGHLRPAIDRRWPLNELPEALRWFAGSHHVGKVILDVGTEASGP